MQDYSKLNVWQKAHELALQVYAATRAFPVHERYGLTAQVRRSATRLHATLPKVAEAAHEQDLFDSWTSPPVQRAKRTISSFCRAISAISSLAFTTSSRPICG